jgi:hypothetical protein
MFIEQYSCSISCIKGIYFPSHLLGMMMLMFDFWAHNIQNKAFITKGLSVRILIDKYLANLSMGPICEYYKNIIYRIVFSVE